jgi:hypothetical protein
MTTWAHSQFPRPDLHRLALRHYGLHHTNAHQWSSRAEAHSIACVSPAPSKIPYGEFSPVRLQTNFQTNDLHDAGRGLSAVRIHRLTPLIRWLSVQTSRLARFTGCSEHVVPKHNPFLESCDSIGHDPSQPPRVRPEALGSPGGYAVPPGPRLLWPHPRLCKPSGSLWFSRPDQLRPRIRPEAGLQSFPNLLRRTVLPCRLPYPGGPERATSGCCITPGSGLRPDVTGSASTLCVSRLQSSLNAAARTAG